MAAAAQHHPSAAKPVLSAAGAALPCAPEPPTSPCTATPSAATPRGRRDLDHQGRSARHLGDAGGPHILKVQLWQNVKPTIALEPIAQQLISLVTVLCQLRSNVMWDTAYSTPPDNTCTVVLGQSFCGIATLVAAFDPDAAVTSAEVLLPW